MQEDFSTQKFHGYAVKVKKHVQQTANLKCLKIGTFAPTVKLKSCENAIISKRNCEIIIPAKFCMSQNYLAIKCAEHQKYCNFAF